ncbi:MAG TPA: hypothetical protein VD757_01880 [Candidatus Nitrosocosmicus sp.]|nr:hypothetical protein [Candidatus Nitrosocosmicus sp.]
MVMDSHVHLYVGYLASMIAELKGIPYEKFEAKTNENTKRLFRIKN